MKVIVVGCGKVGSEIISHLSREGHDITAIDTNAKLIENIINKYDVMGISGSGISYDILSKANVASSDLFIAVTSSDETNMLSCFVAKKCGAKATIARIRNLEYSDKINRLRDDFGIDLVINPEREAAGDIINILNFPEAMEVDLFANGKLDLIEIQIQKNSPLVGKPVSSMRLEFKEEVLVCAVQRGDEVYIPSGQFILNEEDKIHIAANRDNAKRFLSKIGLIENKVKNIIIIGCGILAVYLADNLTKNKYNVKIIEKDYSVCEKYAPIIPKASIINGDGSDQNLLEEEGLSNTDAIICLTGIDEENILISMYAVKRKVHKIITKIDKSSFSDLLGVIGGASIISPKEVIASRIISYVRAYENAYGSNIQTLYKIVNNKVEAIEFIASEKTKTRNIPLKDLKMKKNILIAAIIRDNEVIIPSGLDMIRPNDRVVVVASSDKMFDDLDDILA